MKKYLLATTGLILVLLAALFILTGNGSTPLHVNDVGADPGAFTGTLTLKGVTGAFAPQDPSIFGIMDIKELQCQTPNCNKLLLPVRMQGKLPALGDEVLVTGEFVRSGPYYIFSAQSVEVVRNHTLGGQG